MDKSMTTLREYCRADLISIIGQDKWDEFDKESRIGIMTSEICLRSLKDIGDTVDFSASIIPLMKVLEDALTQKFYLPYLSFLKAAYSPRDYIKANLLDKRDAPPHDLRRKILGYSKKKGGHFYRNGRNKNGNIDFTLGNYQFTVGAENSSEKRCDPTALRFYKEKVFGTSSDDKKVIQWIWNLVTDLDSLLALRNASAHAGIIQTVSEADTAMNAIIKIDKILLTLFFPELP